MGHYNIADAVAKSAALVPDHPAVIEPLRRDVRGEYRYRTTTFAELNRQIEQVAQGLIHWGVQPGQRLALFVPPSREFFALTFGIMRAGATVVLIDPGMGRTNLLGCLSQVEPDGFVGVPLIQWIRRLLRSRFPAARWNVTVGHSGWPVEMTSRRLLARGKHAALFPATTRESTAAIIFTSGSTGPPKGVVYEHGMFAAQVDLLRTRFDIQPGEVDLPAFPLFALFNLGTGVTSVLPDMDFTRPAEVVPDRIQRHLEDHACTQAFGSPAFWNRFARGANQEGWQFPQLKRALSAGAPVPFPVLARVHALMSDPAAEIYTPYGATEALPACVIGGREVLSETAALTAIGRGTCVGRPFPSVSVRVIEIVDGPIPCSEQASECAVGEVGEIIVTGPSVTRSYFRQPEATARSKIQDGARWWHRMGDLGYFDDEGRLWFCGRRAHRVVTAEGPRDSICSEAIFNQHPRVYRSALISVGTIPPVGAGIVIEPEPGQYPELAHEKALFANELRRLGGANPLTANIRMVFFNRSFPVDRRHNIKIHREELTVWARGEPGW